MSSITDTIGSLVRKVRGGIADKRAWWAYRERVTTLPPSHRTAVQGLERYLLYRGGIERGVVLVRMVTDLADLFEQAAADGVPVRGVVGDDPVEFAEDFLANYSDAQWIGKERARLTEAIAQAESEPVSGPVSDADADADGGGLR